MRAVAVVTQGGAVVLVSVAALVVSRKVRSQLHTRMRRSREAAVVLCD